jgi:2-oxoglutarate dehydrogenase E1 component
VLALLRGGASTGGVSSVGADRAAKEGVALAALLNAFETIGHLVADLDPLKLESVYGNNQAIMNKFKVASEELRSRLDYKEYGFTEQDLDREFTISLSHGSSILAQKRVWKLRDVIEAYRTAYCGKIGVEFKHIPERDVCDWIRMNFEGIQYNKMNDKEKLDLYTRLNWSHDFGLFLTQKFNTMKRFGLEGCESFIPGLKVSIDACVQHGAENFVIGMPHRGRLAVLANVVRKPMEVIMAEFQGIKPVDDIDTKYADAGDVKYHLGTTRTRKSLGN